MGPLPTTCPNLTCQAPGISYSRGVVPHALSPVLGAYPILRCERCHTDFFFRHADTKWRPCVVGSGVTFTADPQEIDENNRLDL